MCTITTCFTNPLLSISIGSDIENPNACIPTPFAGRLELKDFIVILCDIVGLTLSFKLASPL